MIRELDSLALAFSLWEQARKDARAAEDQLAQARHATPPLTVAQLDLLSGRISELRYRADSLRELALSELRACTSSGFEGV